MSMTMTVGDVTYDLGSGSFLNCFFSTILVRLELGKRGSRFPMIMEEFYLGQLTHLQSRQALSELAQIRKELERWPPDAVVWDSKKMDASPPWGRNIASSIISLANYFWTSDGQDLFDVLNRGLAESERSGAELTR